MNLFSNIFTGNPFSHSRKSGGGKSSNLPLPVATPGWNTATVPLPTSGAAAFHGWSANSLQSYLQAFQRVPGPAIGNQVATNAQIFPPVRPTLTADQAMMTPEALQKSLEAQNTQSPGMVPSLVATSTGGQLSDAAAALYGRMLGTSVPAPVMTDATKEKVHQHLRQQKDGGVPKLGGPSAAENLYKGMTPIQKQQALDQYNVTQPPVNLG
jgi:hypothetical protein